MNASETSNGLSKTEQIKLKGLELGFSHVGIIPCHDFTDYAHEVASRPDYALFVDNPSSFYAGCFPSSYFPQGKSVICATYGFGRTAFPAELLPYMGRIYLSRCYVPTPDILAGRRLAAMREFLQSSGMEVYEGPIELPARPAAIEAGIVTYGNNNFVYTEEDGSFIVVYTWIVDADLEYDTPSEPANTCPAGCDLCQKACPTGAILEHRRLDCSRCILLNDLAVPMNEDVVNDLDVHIHGCDICQEVCPRNHHVLKFANREDPFLEALAELFDLEKILFMEGFDDPYYRTVIRPIMYNYVRDIDIFRRNAAIAMGNSDDRRYIPALQKAAAKYVDLPSGKAASWALSKLGSVVPAE